MGGKKGNTFQNNNKKYLAVKFDYISHFPVSLVHPRQRRRRQKRPRTWEDSFQRPYWRSERTQLMNFFREAEIFILTHRHNGTKWASKGRKIKFVNLHFLCETQNEIKSWFLTFEIQQILTIRHVNYKLLDFIRILITMLNKQFLWF